MEAAKPMKSAQPMHIEVRLFAYLSRYLPPHANGKRAQLETTAPDVGAIAAELGIPPSVVGVVLLNGRHADADARLQDGDVVSFFPPIAGG